MELVFLGTSAGMPSKFRTTSSLVVNLSEERGTYWLVDCGEAMQHQFMKTPLKPRKIEKIFITHMHGDHIFGLPGFLGSRSFLGGTEKLTIYGPSGIREFVQTALSLSRTHLTYPLEIIEIERGVVFEDDLFVVTADLLAHVIPSYGYRIEQKPLEGKLDIEKALAFGVPKGPLLAKLKSGSDVVLEDGALVKSADVTSPPQDGFIVTILGDTKKCDASIQLARHADVLVHEATFDDDSQQLAASYGHSTFREAGEVAKKAGVRHVIVNHISARFTKLDEQRLLEELKVSDRPSYIADDLIGFRLTRQREIESFTF
ncbi:ribonuclease Z [Chryseomicrobium palamuruense]|uniref:Ribonuclease Z n=1 Tax=Chryseomicrobium palamuruense TaxID=682973 RepID=A0ABV8V0N0_9BACL